MAQDQRDTEVLKFRVSQLELRYLILHAEAQGLETIQVPHFLVSHVQKATVRKLELVEYVLDKRTGDYVLKKKPTQN
jgi:hypothetical protein